MKSRTRKPGLALPGVTGTARVGKPTSTLLPRLQPGDIAVIDHLDLDRDMANALVEAGVRAVVNAAPMISGRYANLGPEVLARAGIVLVDRLGARGIDGIHDDRPIRVDDGVVYSAPRDGPGEELASGRVVDLDQVHAEMDQARSGLVIQLDTLTHSTSEFVRREQELLLNGRGLPETSTSLRARKVVVVAHARHGDLRAIRQFVRQQAPVVVAIGAAAEELLGMGWARDVVVVTSGEPASVPSADALRVAADVILLAPRGSSPAEQAAIEGAGVVPLLVDSSAAAEDLALLLADRQGAEVVVGVGLRAGLEDLLDGQQSGRASTLATRIKLGSRLVDADAVRALYTGRSRAGLAVLVLLAVLMTLVAAVAVTPVGQDWADQVRHHLEGLT